MNELIEALSQVGFGLREQLAQTTAATATPKDLVAMCALLMHDNENVRLGAIEILAAANFRPGMGALKAVARSGKGDERVFAIRALATLATVDDKDSLLELAQGWAAETDTFVKTHASALVAKITGHSVDDSAARAVLSSSAAPQVRNPAELTFGLTSHQQAKRREALVRTLQQHPAPAAALVDAILSADTDGVRLDLVTGLGTLPPEMIASAAPQLLHGGDESTIALVARMLERKLKAAPQALRAPLAAPLEAARKRHVNHVLTASALNAAMLTLVPDAALPALLMRADSLDDVAATGLNDYLQSVPPENWLKGLPELLEALRRAPIRLAPLARGLATGFSAMRPAQRGELKRLLKVALHAPDPDDLRKTHAQRLGTLLALTADVGDPLPTPIVNALEMSGTQDDALVLIDLLQALGTEEAAEHLIPCMQDPDDSVRERARAALEAFPAAHVVVEVDDDDSVHLVPNYRTEHGTPLAFVDGRLQDSSGAAFVLDDKGRPIAEQKTKFGGCLCCSRPRALERKIGVDGAFGRPRCPATSIAYLNDGEQNLIEKEHPLGGCAACETLRPLVRQGDTVTCPTCGVEHVRRTKLGRTAYFPRFDGARRSTGTGTTGPSPRASSSGSSVLPTSIDALKAQLPKAPTPSELQLVEPTIARAMAANAFLLGRLVDASWGGSGIVVAVDDDHVAILTNRHVVERAGMGHNADELADMHALLISGEVAPVRCVWRAKLGVDIALLTGRVEQPGRLAITPLGDGACLVGGDLFAIGNPMGLSWSYTAGACSAFRETTLDDGRIIREIQTQTPVASGSSGGGLYHKNGHLVGVIAWGKNDGAAGTSAHFAVSVPTVRAALEQDNVQWRGASLLARIDALA